MLCTVSPEHVWQRQQGDRCGVTIIEMPRLGYRSLPGWGSGWLDLVLRTRLIVDEEFDLVWGFEHQPVVAWPVYLTQAHRGYRFVSDWCDWHAGGSNTFHGWRLAHQLDAVFENGIRRKAQDVTVISTVLQARAIGLGLPSQRVHLIGEGVDTEYIHPIPMADMRERFGLPLRARIITCITDGDMSVPVEILAAVRRSLPDCHLMVIGRRDAAVARTAERYGLLGWVHETGFMSDEDLPCLLACADVCFLPLEDNLVNRARWPQKINDFLAAGKPTVISPVGDVAGLFRQNEIGGLACGVKGFADTIVNLLANENLRKHCGEMARTLAVEMLDWRVFDEKIAMVAEMRHA